MKRVLLLCWPLIVLCMSGRNSVGPHLIPKAPPARISAAGFDLPAPKRLSHARRLWATWYWIPSYHTSRLGVPILDTDEAPLGPRLSRKEFCSAAVEGSVRIDGQVYNFADLGDRKLTDCTDYWPTMLQAPYVRFSKSASPFGEGENGYYLAPYRSIAVDRSYIPLGTVFYIPQARGTLLTLPDGRKVRHDGYFFAADQGYGIERAHIDVFIGVSQKNPFPWVTSTAEEPFTAYVVRDPTILARLTAMHRPSATRVALLHN